MTSVEVDTNTTAAAAAPQPRVTATVVNVYCVEATVENTGRMQALLEGLRNGDTPTAETLTRAGMTGMELTAGVDTTIESIRGVVEQQRLSGLKASATAAASEVDDGDARLTFFAVSRGSAVATATTEATEKDDDDDPLVALSDKLSLEEVLNCPQIFAMTRPGDVVEGQRPTVLLFYTHGSKWGGCCCCGGLVGAFLSFFCGCCGSSRPRPRSPRRPRSVRHSRSNSANPLDGRFSSNSSVASNNGYYPNQPGQGYYPAQPGTGYGNNNNNYNANPAYAQYGNPNPVPVYAAIPEAQIYYPPPQMNNGGGEKDPGAYYKPM